MQAVNFVYVDLKTGGPSNHLAEGSSIALQRTALLGWSPKPKRSLTKNFLKEMNILE